MDVCDAYILAAIGDARDAAALSAQMQPLQQVPAWERTNLLDILASEMTMLNLRI